MHKAVCNVQGGAPRLLQTRTFNFTRILAADEEQFLHLSVFVYSERVMCK